ncbi:MAG: hypothetical protein QOH57_313 [Mycobacterium sp.]|jgi:hypothetical protein|nr:hypothetical protein [Mycobacterium sp.]
MSACAKSSEAATNGACVSDQPTTPDDADVAPPAHVDIRVERGNPTDDEVAALVAVLGSAAGGASEPAEPERNLWGHPADKLRYSVFSWQRVTLFERTHVRR